MRDFAVLAETCCLVRKCVKSATNGRKISKCLSDKIESKGLQKTLANFWTIKGLYLAENVKKKGDFEKTALPELLTISVEK